MPSILDDIVAAKRKELARQKETVPLTDLEERIASQPRPLNLSGALLGGGVRLIAEVKKASPSRGLLCPDFDPVRLAGTYTSNGAAAVSVLTDRGFKGSWSTSSRSKKPGPPNELRCYAKILFSTRTRCMRPVQQEQMRCCSS